MNALQRAGAAFAAAVFLAAVAKITAAIGFGWGVVIFDSVALLATGICGWIAWYGRLSESQRTVQSVKMVLACLVLLFVAFFLIAIATLPEGGHDMGH